MRWSCHSIQYLLSTFQDMEILGKFKFPLNNLVKSRRLNVLRDLELKLGAINAKLGHSEGMVLYLFSTFQDMEFSF